MDMTLLRRPADDAMELVEDLSRRLGLVRRGSTASGGCAGAEGYARDEAGAELLLSSAGVWTAAEPRAQTASLHIWIRVGGVEFGVWIAAELRSQSSVSTETSKEPGIMGAIAIFGGILMGLREREASASEV